MPQPCALPPLSSQLPAIANWQRFVFFDLSDAVLFVARVVASLRNDAVYFTDSAVPVLDSLHAAAPVTERAVDRSERRRRVLQALLPSQVISVVAA